MNIRTITAGTIIVATMSLIAPANACDDRFPHTCPESPSASSAIVDVGPVQPPLVLNRHSTRARVKHDQRKPVLHARASDQEIKDEADASKASNDAVATAKPSVRPYMPSVALPPSLTAAGTTPVGSVPSIATPTFAPVTSTAEEESGVMSQDEYNEIDRLADASSSISTSAMKTVVVDRPQEVKSAPVTDKQEETPWLRHILVGLGGLLTVASAVRLFVG